MSIAQIGAEPVRKLAATIARLHRWTDFGNPVERRVFQI